MNKMLLVSFIFLAAAATTYPRQSDFPKLSGPYLGQKSPGMTPEIFAPGIISRPDSHEFGCTFSSDGKEFYYTSGRGALSEIWCSRVENGVWTPPEQVKFSEGYFAHEPHVTFDGKKLFFGSKRPQPGNKEAEQYGIWFTEKEKNGWSEAKFAGQGTQVSSTRDGKLYVTDNSGPEDGYLSRVTMADGRFVKYERLLDGIEKLRPKYTRIAHPCIAPDDSYIVFDVEGGSHLFVSFKNSNGTWNEPVDLADHGFNEEDGIASISPDGKYLFFGRNQDIYWVDTKIIGKLKPKV